MEPSDTTDRLEFFSGRESHLNWHFYFISNAVKQPFIQNLHCARYYSQPRDDKKYMKGQMQTAFYRRGLSTHVCWYLKKVLEFQSLSDSNIRLCNMVSAKLQQNPQNCPASIITARTILEDGKAGRVAMQAGGFHG